MRTKASGPSSRSARRALARTERPCLQRGVQTTVDGDELAGEVAGVLRPQEADHRRHFRGLHPAAQRNPGEYPVAELLAPDGLGHRGLDHPKQTELARMP